MLADLAAIEREFDEDIRELLQYSNLTTEEGEERRSKRARAASFLKKLGGGGLDVELSGGDAGVVPGAAAAFARGGDGGAGVRAPEGSVAGVESEYAINSSGHEDDVQSSSPSARRLAVHEVFALRIMATCVTEKPV